MHVHALCDSFCRDGWYSGVLLYSDDDGDYAGSSTGVTYAQKSVMICSVGKKKCFWRNLQH